MERNKSLLISSALIALGLFSFIIHLIAGKPVTSHDDIRSSAELSQVIFNSKSATEKDIAQAAKRIGLLATEGDPAAMHYLVALFDMGYETEIKDRKQANALIEESATLGFSQAQYSMGHAFEFGETREKNCYEAFKWYIKAKKNGSFLANKRLAGLSISQLEKNKEFITSKDGGCLP